MPRRATVRTRRGLLPVRAGKDLERAIRAELRRAERRVGRATGTSSSRRRGDAQTQGLITALDIAHAVHAATRRGPLRNALRTIRRLTFRLRHQIAPVALIALIWLAGSAAHRIQHGMRTVLVTGAVGLVFGWLATRRWLDRPAERVYAIGCMAAAVAWLAVAAARGAERPLPAVLWLGGCALALPWWRHHRIRGAMRPGPAPSIEQIWAERVAAPDRALRDSALTSVQRVRNGWTATISLPPGKHATDDAVTATALITSAYEKPIGSVIVEPTSDGNAAKARLMVLATNPLHEPHRWAGPSLDPATGIAAIGCYADGNPAPYRFYRYGSGPMHDLISGTTDAGKSSLVGLLLAEERHSGLIVSWVIDPQRGQSLPDWTEAVDWFAGTSAEAMRMLRAARGAMYGRNAFLATVAWTDDQARARRGRGYFDPSPEMPVLSLTIEEAHVILAIPEARQIAEDIAKMGRKCGVRLRLITQVPLLDQLGGSTTLRDMVASGNVIVFRTANRLTGTVAFNGVLPVDPARLPRQFPNGSATAGLGFVLGPSDRPVTMRAYLVVDPYYWATTGVPVPLDELTVSAAGADYATRHQRQADDEQDGAGAAEPLPAASQAPAAGDPRGSARSATDAVLSALADAGSEATRGELIAATKYSPRAITDALSALVADGRVIKTGHGRYRLASAGEPPAA
jgi:hypothetical protein